MQQQTTPAEQTSVPSLPCPHCQENILATGFYNYCNETVSLREDNRTQVVRGQIYMDHDEEGHETTDHECDVDAYCAECNKLLPWPLYEIRGLDGSTLTEAEGMIGDLITEIRDDTAGNAVPAA